MKHIDFTNIGLGMELSPSFAKQNQEALLERLSAMLKGLTNNAVGIVILDGCVMTKVGTQYDQTAGVVYYNGEILTVDAFSGNHATQVPVYQAPTNTFTQQAWYGDAALRDTFYSRKLPMAMAVAGSGIADYDEVTRMQSNWVDITFVNGWVAGAEAPQYRLDSFGRVDLRGLIDGTAATLASAIDNIPRHSIRDIRLQVVRTDAGGSGESWRLNITPASTIAFAGATPATGKIFSLDGLTYWIN